MTAKLVQAWKNKLDCLTVFVSRLHLVGWFLNEEQFNKLTAYYWVNWGSQSFRETFIRSFLELLIFSEQLILKSSKKYWNELQWLVLLWSSTLLYTGSLWITAHWKNEWHNPLYPCERGKGAALLEMGKGTASAGSFWWAAEINPNPTMRDISHSLCQPSPHVVLLLRAPLPSVKADIWSRRSFTSDCPRERTTPRRAQLLCCRMPQSVLKMLWVETGVLFTTGALLFIDLGLRKEKVIYCRTAFAVPQCFRTVLQSLGFKAHRNLFLHKIKQW